MFVEHAADVDVAIVIVNFRTAGATIEAVGGLSADLEELRDSRVIVVDNASGDDSLQRLQEAFGDPKWRGRVEVADAGRNGGFGSGVNVGIARALALDPALRYVYILNPDAVIAPGALLALVRFMESHPDAGMLGNEVRNRGADVTRGFRFPTVWSELEGAASFGPLSRLLRKHAVPVSPAESCEVDWVSGVSMLVRREVFSTVGLFDEDFFLYFEEVDLAKRLQSAGFKTYFVADIVVDHVGGLSTGFKDETRRMPGYWFDSRRRYFVKHHGRLYAVACDAARLCGYALFKAKIAVSSRTYSLRPSFGRDLLRYSVANFLKAAPGTPTRARG
ncbi:MAG TPA: glycosyltransferase family 2 protein [Polyangia bacterium]